MRNIYFLAIALGSMATANAQNSFGQMQNQIPRNQSGINQFDVKKDSVQFKGISVDLGGSFALQFQAQCCHSCSIRSDCWSPRCRSRRGPERW